MRICLSRCMPWPIVAAAIFATPLSAAEKCALAYNRLNFRCF